MGIIIAAKFFVSSIQGLAMHFHFDPKIFALFVAPIATELPEKFNSIIWIGKKKDTLALGNITGAMVFQSSIVVFVGVIGTNWILDARAIASVVVTLLSAFVIMGYMKVFKKLNAYVLLSGLFFYVFYILLVIFIIKPQHV
jgi:cation:H+ antiporter